MLALGALIIFVVPAFAQEHPKPAPPQKETVKKEEPAKDAPKEEKGPYKKYSDVITDKAVSQDGLVKVHRIDDKVYFEIPDTLLMKDLLWQTEVAGVPSNSRVYSGFGAGTQVVCFARRNGKVYLQLCDNSMRSVGDAATTLGVQQNSIAPMLMSWDVQTEGKLADGTKTTVIDVTSLYTSDPQDFQVKGVIGGAAVDPGRSYIQKIKAFPENIETTSMLTFVGGGRPGPFAGGPSAQTAMVHYSLDKLPDTPMKGRLKDSRIGYFTQGFTEYGRPELRTIDLEYINRYRLEKKDPNAAVSDPVKPIVFYIAREVPSQWRESLKKAVEDWQPAFEQAGFSHAIIAKDAPTPEQDPDWDAEDARYSVIRWVPSATANAMGPSIQDPRSGETLSAHIIVWSNVLDLAQNWYFAQCANIDPKARQLPMPDDLMQKLIRYVVCHEVGHTLGLEHNMKGSAWYTAEQLRNPAFTDANGVGCSIMDYSRFNYVAQPGDGVTHTIGQIGPYDKFAIEYGYKPIPGAWSPDAEKPALDALLSRQVTDPTLRFGNYKYSQDPTTQSEDIGSDAVAVGTYGLKNLDAIASNYLWTSTVKYGEDYSRLSAMRQELLQQRMLELNHVLRQLGGVVETDYHAGHGDAVFAPVTVVRQRAAAKFIIDRGLRVPVSLFNPQVVTRIEPNGLISEATLIPRIMLSGMLADSRIQRMADNEAASPTNSYHLADYVSDICNGVFSELAAPAPKVDVYRRALQRTYLDTMDKKINGATKTDLRLVARANLKTLALNLNGAIPRTTDSMTRLHLQECRSDIAKILDNKYSTPGAAAPMSLADFLGGIAEGIATSDVGNENCWSHDLIDPDLRKEMEAQSGK